MAVVDSWEIDVCQIAEGQVEVESWEDVEDLVCCLGLVIHQVEHP